MPMGAGHIVHLEGLGSNKDWLYQSMLYCFIELSKQPEKSIYFLTQQMYFSSSLNCYYGLRTVFDIVWSNY